MAVDTGSHASNNPIKTMPPAMPKMPDRKDVARTDKATNDKRPIPKG